MRYGRGFAVVLTLGLTYGCGSDPADDCGKMVDAIAHSWERCGRTTYDNAKKILADAFPCGSLKDSNPDQVDQCVNDVNALTGSACEGVKNNGTLPNSCTMGALKK